MRTARRTSVTTEVVLLEVLARVARGGPTTRAAAVDLVRTLRRAERVVLRITTDLFDRGVALYEARPDKRYSLADCISMVVCRDRVISEVLTHDRDFEQEGFRALLRTPS